MTATQHTAKVLFRRTVPGVIGIERKSAVLPDGWGPQNTFAKKKSIFIEIFFIIYGSLALAIVHTYIGEQICATFPSACCVLCRLCFWNSNWAHSEQAFNISAPSEVHSRKHLKTQYTDWGEESCVF
ncbi:hypothetical protein XELAEV_18021568mg [Xenopus laevis]|uniref:Uncharacterized protein n=1 Tax=Xenopus laevis TaxID=8355 RepID=A0A974D988_XENLA|nr:hypothetical protein XELAEV_18021568mg [Xenopus laevis]